SCAAPNTRCRPAASPVETAAARPAQETRLPRPAARQEPAAAFRVRVAVPYLSQRGLPRFLLSFCATRAFTNLLISAIGIGLSKGKWMVPLDVVKPFSSFLNVSITDAVGNKLQWSENAANHTSTPLCLNAGIS